MSREDDFDDIMDSSDDVDSGQDSTSEPILDEESLDESSTDETGDLEVVVTAATLVEEPEAEEE